MVGSLNGMSMQCITYVNGVTVTVKTSPNRHADTQKRGQTETLKNRKVNKIWNFDKPIRRQFETSTL